MPSQSPNQPSRRAGRRWTLTPGMRTGPGARRETSIPAACSAPILKRAAALEWLSAAIPAPPQARMATIQRPCRVSSGLPTA